MGTPVRFTSGLSTVKSIMPLGDFPFPDPFRSGGSITKGVVSFDSDFTNLSVNQFTVVGTSSTFALEAASLGGTAILTPGGAATASAAYMVPSFMKFVSGSKMWFVARVKVSAVAGNVVFAVGLRKGADVTDGIWFTKPAASAVLTLVSAVDNTATDVATALLTTAADTYMEVAFYYDGTDVLAFVNGALVARVSAPTIGSTATTLTDELLCPFVSITPTATDTLTIDYVMCAQEVTR